MMWIILLFAQAALFGSNIRDLRRQEPEPMRVSVIIPCVPKHFRHIPGLLEAYKQQTVLPDQVVIALSEANKISRDEIEAIQRTSWPFAMHIIEDDQPRSAGSNRNAACMKSSGNLIVCQDADDLPHPQRIEIVKSIFETHQVDHLMHLYTSSLFPTEPYDLDHLPISCRLGVLQAIAIRDTTNGNVCFTREVFNKVRWGNQFQMGEDTAFNKKVYRHFSNCVVLHLPLLLYRRELSSFK